MESPSATVAEIVAERLSRLGVARIYGIPGGGTPPLLAAADKQGIRFVLTHQETSAAIMASTEAGHGSAPGVVVTSSGPGAAAVVNGLAHAALDRAPILVLTDRQPDSSNGAGYHQWLDHRLLYSGVVKASLDLTADDPGAVIDHACELAMTGQPGPVHIDIPVGLARATAGTASIPRTTTTQRHTSVDAATLARIRECRRPVIIAGLGAQKLSAGILDDVAERLRAPVYATYKGKGALDERSPWAAGIFMAGVPERAILDDADVVVSIGLDPTELFGTVPDLAGRRVALDANVPTPGVLAPPEAQFVGDLDTLVSSLPTDGGSEWTSAEIVEHRDALERRLAAVASDDERMHPWEIAHTINAHSSPDADMAVDAGAHMLPVAQAWRTTRPGGFVISNGLATMGCGLPGAIARSVAQPERRVICCTGDGGLLMVAGELATAGRETTRLTVVVFDDRSLSLIRVKQTAALRERGLGIDGVDWQDVGRGFGFTTHAVATTAELQEALGRAEADDRPHLIVAATDPEPYSGIIEILRG